MTARSLSIDDVSAVTSALADEAQRRVKVDSLTIDGPLELLAGRPGAPAALTFGSRADTPYGLHLTWVADDLADVRRLHQQLGDWLAQQEREAA